MPPSTERPSPVPRTALTPSVEGYLSAIYALAHDGEPVGTQAIASELGIAAPSVTEMLRRLDAHGLVEYRRGSGARPDALGRARRAPPGAPPRRDRALHHETIGLPADEAAEEARTLEHHLSDRLVARIGEIVGEAPGAWCRRVGTLPADDRRQTSVMRPGGPSTISPITQPTVPHCSRRHGGEQPARGLRVAREQRAHGIDARRDVGVRVGRGAVALRAARARGRRAPVPRRPAAAAGRRCRRGHARPRRRTSRAGARAARSRSRR